MFEHAEHGPGRIEAANDDQFQARAGRIMHGLYLERLTLIAPFPHHRDHTADPLSLLVIDAVEFDHARHRGFHWRLHWLPLAQRTAGEGIEVPACDAVLLADPGVLQPAFVDVIANSFDVQPEKRRDIDDTVQIFTHSPAP